MFNKMLIEDVVHRTIRKWNPLANIHTHISLGMAIIVHIDPPVFMIGPAPNMKLYGYFSGIACFEKRDRFSFGSE
jgi:hypothetical protein